MTLEGAMLSTSVPQQQANSDALKRSNRTRNRKVNYAALNAGITADTDQDLASEPESDVISAPAHAGTESRRAAATASQHYSLTDDALPMPVDSHLGNTKYAFTEEAEIRRLKLKMKRRGLSEIEKRKLKQLKTRLGLKVAAFRKKLDKLRKNNDQPHALANKSFRVKKALSDATASLASEVPATGGSEMLAGSRMNSLSEEPLVVKTKTNTKTVEVVHPAAQNLFSQLPASASTTSFPVKTESDSHYVTATVVSAPVATHSAAARPALKPPVSRRRTVLPVLHRSNQRSRPQHGKLYTHLHTSRDAHCVECATCGEMMAVRAFVKHLHHPKNASDLLTVAVAHKLELGSDAVEHTLAWNAFSAKREQFEQGRTRTTSGSRRRDSNASETQRKMTSPSETVRSVLQQATPKVVITPLRVNTAAALAACATTAQTQTPSTPGVRHSSRTRKRKQLHPMESYVYTSPTGEVESKRRRSGSIGDA